MPRISGMKQSFGVQGGNYGIRLNNIPLKTPVFLSIPSTYDDGEAFLPRQPTAPFVLLINSVPQSPHVVKTRAFKKYFLPMGLKYDDEILETYKIKIWQIATLKFIFINYKVKN